jgi:hypothetical protein
MASKPLGTFTIVPSETFVTDPFINTLSIIIKIK